MIGIRLEWVFSIIKFGIFGYLVVGFGLMSGFFVVYVEIFFVNRLNCVLFIGWFSIFLMEGCVKWNSC